MSLVMDPPLNVQKSLAAARTKDTTSSSSPSSSTSTPSTSTPSSSSPNAVLHHLGACGALSSTLFVLGLCGPLFSVLAGLGLAAAFVSGAATNPLLRAAQFIATTRVQEQSRKINVEQWIDGYNDLHHRDSDYVADGDKAGVDQRNSSYTKLVNAYYELATLFYEIGWGTSFHFATRRKNETFKESIKRHEYYLASKLVPAGRGANNLAGLKVLDCGCGVGGPYRNIATFTGADVTGITLNEYQVQRGNTITRNDGLSHLCRSVQGDFMKMPFKDESFDAAYAIEATCHAPKREGVYQEIFRVLKPGAVCAMYEWCLTDKYDSKNAEHRVIKKQIEEGDGLPDMCVTSEIPKAAQAVGFEVLESRDVVNDTLPGDIPWYHPLTPSWNVLTQRFQFTNIGMSLTTNGLKLLEAIKLAPAGTAKVQTMLLQASRGLVRGGELGIFTPMYLCVIRKPAAE